MKLSQTQIRVLKALAEPGEKGMYMGYLGSFNPTAYWCLMLGSGMGHIRCATMDKLNSLTFVAVGGSKATITPLGREYLANLESPDET